MKAYDENMISEILENYRNVAVVGISDKKDRDSYQVSEYLSRKGYNIIPINPKFSEWNGIKAFPDLASIPKDINVDIVDIFRKPEAVVPVVREALSIKPKVIWMQEGVINEEAADLARESGLKVVMDRCMMKEHEKLNR